MQMFLISDNIDTYTGMRLAGVEGVVVHTHDELKDALQKAIPVPYNINIRCPFRLCIQNNQGAY